MWICTKKAANHRSQRTHARRGGGRPSPAAAQTRRGPPPTGGWRSAPRSRLEGKEGACMGRLGVRGHRAGGVVLHPTGGWMLLDLGHQSSPKTNPNTSRTPASSCFWICSKRSAWPSTEFWKSTRPLREGVRAGGWGAFESGWHHGPQSSATAPSSGSPPGRLHEGGEQVGHGTEL